MKASVIVRLVCWSVALVVLIGVLILGISGGFSRFTGFGELNFDGFPDYKDSEYIIGGGEVDAEGVSKIYINWVSGSVNIQPYQGSCIVIEENSGLSENNQLRYKVDNGTLLIKSYKGRFGLFSFFRSMPNKDLTLKLPESLAASLAELKADVTSAGIYVSDISAVKTDIDAVSGEVNMKNTVSESADIESVSGNIKLSGCSINSVDAETTSGKFIFDGEAGFVNAESVSGDISVDLSVCPGRFDAETVSGDVRMAIPDNNGFSVGFDTVSGKMSCDFAMTQSGDRSVYGNGAAVFDIDTVSGGLIINKR